MDDAAGVGVGDGLADLLEGGDEPTAVGGRVGPVAEHRVEGPPLDQLHGQERPAVGQGAEVVDRRDAGVLELAGDPGLVDEPTRQQRPGGEPLLQDLDGHLAAEGAVVGARTAPMPPRSISSSSSYRPSGPSTTGVVDEWRPGSDAVMRVGVAPPRTLVRSAHGAVAHVDSIAIEIPFGNSFFGSIPRS